MFALCEDVLCGGGSSTPGSAAPRPAHNWAATQPFSGIFHNFDTPSWHGGHAELFFAAQLCGYEGVSKCDFAMSRDVACRVSMSATTYKIFNINGLFSQIVETQNFASLLQH